MKDAFDAVAEELDDLRQSPLGTAMDAGVELDNERWNVNRIPATEKQAELSAFLRNRKEDVADLMEALKDQYAPQQTAIESVITSEEPASYFDVLGRQIDESTSGIVIMRYPDGTTLKKLAR